MQHDRRWGGEMVAGRELDAAVAEHVMGLDVEVTVFEPTTPEGHADWYGPCDGFADGECSVCKGSVSHNSPYYSTSIAAAWEVVEKVGAVRIELFSDGWYAQFGSFQHNRKFTTKAGVADTAPHAICLAALAAVGALPEDE